MTINNNTYFQDDDYNLNIDDIDLNVKAWASAISSSLEFMRALLQFQIFYDVFFFKKILIIFHKKYVKKRLNEKRSEKSENGNSKKGDKTENPLSQNSAEPLVKARYDIIFKFFEYFNLTK